MADSPSLPSLKPNLTPGAQAVLSEAGVWRLEIPAGRRGAYRLAQIDDYGSLARAQYPWQPPLRLRLRARASMAKISGTWGFGLWNDPFGMGFLPGETAFHLPALPNAAWFFFASPQNYLSFRDDLPAQGALAATFRSPHWSTWQTMLSGLALPLLLCRPGARRVRRWLRRRIQQGAIRMKIDPTGWHAYQIDWKAGQVSFLVDEQMVLDTAASPLAPLGLVIWVDNQYAAFTSEGRIAWGTLENTMPAWIEVSELKING